MYYRVASFKKDDDSREMILRASSTEEAKKKIQSAKAFLFPGEDSKDYACWISPFPIKTYLGTTIVHYRIHVIRPKEGAGATDDFEDCEWQSIIQANSIKQAKENGRKLLLDSGENPDEYETYADVITVDECIREEERSLRRTIANTYTHLQKTDSISVKEYNDFCRRFDMDKNPEQYYEALKAFNRYLRMIYITVRQCDRENFSVKKLLDTVECLYRCDNREEFDQIVKTITESRDACVSYPPKGE